MAKNKEEIQEAAQLDYQKQTTYDKGYDRRAGFVQGANWMKDEMKKEIVDILFKFHKEGNSRAVYSKEGIEKWLKDKQHI